MTAQELNNHLASGGVVQVSTYGKSKVYHQVNTGDFTQRDNGLYVRRGRGRDYLGPIGRPWVSIRTGRFVPKGGE